METLLMGAVFVCFILIVWGIFDQAVGEKYYPIFRTKKVANGWIALMSDRPYAEYEITDKLQCYYFHGGVICGKYGNDIAKSPCINQVEAEQRIADYRQKKGE
jgi:hypothetical protein